MEIEFKEQQYDRLELESVPGIGLSTNIVSIYRKRLAFIRAAVDERDFYALKSLHFEKLKGKRQGQYSMRLNDQWRLILEFVTSQSGKRVVVVSVEDYHQ